MIPRIIALSTKLQKYAILKSNAKNPKERYQSYKPLRKNIFRSLVPFANKVSTDFIQSHQIDHAIRVNAEICFNKGTGYIDLQWRERVLLVGLLAAYTKNFSQAAEWLAVGVNQFENKLVSRCCTYGYSQEFIDWVLQNQEMMTTPQGWKDILETSSKSHDDFCHLILRVSTMVHSMGLKSDVAALLIHIDNANYQDWIKALLNRSEGALLPEDKIFSAKETWSGSYDNIFEKIQLNIFNRVFSEPIASQLGEVNSFVTQQEADWLRDNNYNFTANPQFHLLCQAFQQLFIEEHVIAKNMLQDEVSTNVDFFQDLQSRQGPLRVFVGGYGWTGSGAIYDSFRGYPNVKEMPGAGNHVPYLNEGAESEPMIHQGPAGVLAFANQVQKNGNITIAMWKKFFRLYVLTDLSRSYFEYKTIHANKLIREQIGVTSYYRLLVQFVHAQAGNTAIKIKSKRRVAQISALKQYESNMVKSLFENDNDVVLFNNSINTHNVNTLTYLNGQSVYIAVNRSIFDQLADQRKSNIFFNTTVKKFAKTKSMKIQKYFSARKVVDPLVGIRFHDIQFEDWVQNHKYRAETTKEILGSFSPKHDAKYFTPALSAKNIGIYDHSNSPKEKSLLDSLVAKNKHL